MRKQRAGMSTRGLAGPYPVGGLWRASEDKPVACGAEPYLTTGNSRPGKALIRIRVRPGRMRLLTEVKQA